MRASPVAERDAVAVRGDRSRDIEVLRAFAVLGVIAHHVSSSMPGTTAVMGMLFGPFNLGAGVDLFFRDIGLCYRAEPPAAHRLGPLAESALARNSGNLDQAGLPSMADSASVVGDRARRNSHLAL